MDKRYGKIKNGKLILASSFIRRDGAFLYNAEDLYKAKGYKEICYSECPQNKEGYNLVSTWEEQNDVIIQKWNYEQIPDDYSGNLLVAMQHFDVSICELKEEVHRNYEANDELIKSFFEKEKLIRMIYDLIGEDKDAEQLLHILHNCDLDMEFFLRELGILEDVEMRGFYVRKYGLLRKTVEVTKILENKSEGQNEEIDKSIINDNWILPQYFKSCLSELREYEKCQTNSNITMYNMAFIYLFTLFDELLLTMIRIVCMHEKKWLMSNSDLSAMEILKCDTTDELHLLLVEKKIKELSWESYDDKLNFLKQRGILVDEENIELFNQKMLYLSVKRNILVHNGGVWSDVVKDSLKGTPYYKDIVVGEKVNRSKDGFDEACLNVELAAEYLYKQVCDKFGFLFQYEFGECNVDEEQC